MAITPLVEAGIALASEIFKFINEKEKKKYSERIVKYRNALNDELRKPVDKQNDAYIEKLEEDILTITDLALAEIRAYVQNNTSN